MHVNQIVNMKIMYTLTQVKYIHSNAERKIMNCYRNLQQICTLVSSTSPSLFSPSVFSESESKPPAFSKRSSKESSSNYDKYMRLKIKGQLEICEQACTCIYLCSGIIQMEFRHRADGSRNPFFFH